MFKKFGYCMGIYALWSLCLQAYSFTRLCFIFFHIKIKLKKLGFNWKIDRYMCSILTFMSVANLNELAEHLAFKKNTNTARSSATGYKWFMDLIWCCFRFLFSFFVECSYFNIFSCFYFVHLFSFRFILTLV